jgi:hypothetical protein
MVGGEGTGPRYLLLRSRRFSFPPLRPNSWNRRWLIVFGSPKAKNMGLRTVDEVVIPSEALLHSNAAPFPFGHELALGQDFGEVFGQDHMPVLVGLITVFFAVLNLVGICLDDSLNGVPCDINHEIFTGHAARVIHIEEGLFTDLSSSVRNTPCVTTPTF